MFEKLRDTWRDRDATVVSRIRMITRLILDKRDHETSAKLGRHKTMIQHHVEERRESLEHRYGCKVDMFRGNFLLICAFACLHAKSGVKYVQWCEVSGSTVAILHVCCNIGIIVRRETSVESINIWLIVRGRVFYETILEAICYGLTRGASIYNWRKFTQILAVHSFPCFP